jgi:hypothetical protein
MGTAENQWPMESVDGGQWPVDSVFGMVNEWVMHGGFGGGFPGGRVGHRF